MKSRSANTPRHPNWFIGIPVPGGWLDALLERAPGDLRRLHADDLHVTVAFLGACGRERAERAFGLLDEGLEVRAVLERIHGFGGRRRPSAYSLVLGQGNEEVVAYLRRWRDRLLLAANARPDPYEPYPHVTIGRPPRRAPPEVAQVLRDWALSTPPLDVEVLLDDVALYTWSEDRRVRQFRILRRLSQPSA